MFFSQRFGDLSLECFSRRFFSLISISLFIFCVVSLVPISVFMSACIHIGWCIYICVYGRCICIYIYVCVCVCMVYMDASNVGLFTGGYCWSDHQLGIIMQGVAVPSSPTSQLSRPVHNVHTGVLGVCVWMLASLIALQFSPPCGVVGLSVLANADVLVCPAMGGRRGFLVAAHHAGHAPHPDCRLPWQC